MLIKSPDDKKKRLRLLEELQKSDRIDERQRKWLREEYWRFKPGMAGERDAVHYLDMSFGEGKNHAILHVRAIEAEVKAPNTCKKTGHSDLARRSACGR